jgi:phage tail-like protein
MKTEGEEPADAPTSAGNFRVYVDGVEVALSQVIGLAWSDPEDAEPTGSGDRLTLRRAVSGDRQLYDLRARRESGSRDTSEVVIELWNAAYTRPVAAWGLVGAEPTRWRGPELDAMRRAVAFEELELRYDRLEWRDPTAGGQQ